MALRVTEDEGDCVKAVIAISPDSHTGESDAAADAFLRNQAHGAANRRLVRRLTKLPRPPYLNATAFLQRTRLLADLGTIEAKKTFAALMREMVLDSIHAYGVAGTFKSLRNMNLVQTRLLPQIVSLDIFGNPPRVKVPVHYVFGDRDAVTPATVPDRLPAAIAAPASTVTRVADAGHMLHFDRPDIVRSIAERL
jgi:pimeloyl-ACP methyl ester carboxylesterase